MSASVELKRNTETIHRTKWSSCPQLLSAGTHYRPMLAFLQIYKLFQSKYLEHSSLRGFNIHFFSFIFCTHFDKECKTYKTCYVMTVEHAEGPIYKA